MRAIYHHPLAVRRFDNALARATFQDAGVFPFTNFLLTHRVLRDGIYAFFRLVAACQKDNEAQQGDAENADACHAAVWCIFSPANEGCGYHPNGLTTHELLSVRILRLPGAQRGKQAESFGRVVAQNALRVFFPSGRSLRL